MTTEAPTSSTSSSRIPINRVVAFLGPVIAVVAGAIADWLLLHVHVLGDFRERSQVVSGISQMIVFGVTAVLVWAGQSKWLTGWQRQEKA